MPTVPFHSGARVYHIEEKTIPLSNTSAFWFRAVWADRAALSKEKVFCFTSGIEISLPPSILLFLLVLKFSTFRLQEISKRKLRENMPSRYSILATLLKVPPWLNLLFFALNLLFSAGDIEFLSYSESWQIITLTLKFWIERLYKML